MLLTWRRPKRSSYRTACAVKLHLHIIRVSDFEFTGHVAGAQIGIAGGRGPLYENRHSCQRRYGLQILSCISFFHVIECWEGRSRA